MAALMEEKDRENTMSIIKSVNYKYPLLRRHYPTAAFPLFLTSLQYLQMVDGTLENPFYLRNKDGSIVKDKSDDAQFDVDGMDLLVMLDVLDDQSESDDSVLETILEGEEDEEPDCMQDKPEVIGNLPRQRVHMTYQVK